MSRHSSETAVVVLVLVIAKRRSRNSEMHLHQRPLHQSSEKIFFIVKVMGGTGSESAREHETRTGSGLWPETRSWTTTTRERTWGRC